MNTLLSLFWSNSDSNNNEESDDESLCHDNSYLIDQISAPEDANWKEWISATSIRNYLCKDPVIDWLKHNYMDLCSKYPQHSNKIIRATSNNKDPNSFIGFIMEQGQKFETNVIRLIEEKFGSDLLISIGGELDPFSTDKITETLDAMNKGYPFIHSGLLHNSVNKTYGIPDLLVRSDWINELVDLNVLTLKEITKSAKNLLNISNDSGNAPDYHYVVVDIKFSTLNLKCNGINLLNSGHVPAYKGQLRIYNLALGELQGYTPNCAYLLGRKWKYGSKGDVFKGNTCFGRLGVIDYSTADSEYVELTDKAIEWVRLCRSDEAKSWNISKLPLPREELYPNMSNSHDYPWREVKEIIAKDINEITSVWMLGTRHRKKAHEINVLRWSNPKCTSKNLGMKEGFTSNIVDKILNINRPARSVRKRKRKGSKNNKEIKIRPAILTNNMCNWQNKQTIEFFVDFETINDVIITDFSRLPTVENTSMIFMIGIGHIEPMTNRWIYKHFTVNNLTPSEEARICKKASDYIISEADIYQVENPLCFHWAHAEETFWNDAVERHPNNSSSWHPDEWEWMDLLKVFKREPIVIKDCLSFSLKEVATTMAKHGFIKTTWNTHSACVDGQGAMVGAWKCYKEAKRRNISMRNLPLMKEIIKYNEVDVKVLQEITDYLRNNHIKPNSYNKETSIATTSATKNRIKRRRT